LTTVEQDHAGFHLKEDGFLLFKVAPLQTNLMKRVALTVCKTALN
jgi:hypothetical protein